jgi:hypothetical protein
VPDDVEPEAKIAGLDLTIMDAGRHPGEFT